MTASAGLTVGLIGCGRMGVFTSERTRAEIPAGWLPLSHAEAIRSLPGFELAALCDSDEQQLARAGAHLGIRRLYTDHQAMIGEVQPEVVAIATRAPGRCDIIEFASDWGVRGIHAEKPLGQSLAECRRALAAVARTGATMTYGTYRRFHATYRRAKELLAAGEIGELQHVAIEHGRAQLLWAHPHSVDLILFFNDRDDVEYVQADCTIASGSVGQGRIDDDPVLEHAYVKMKNGVSASISKAGGFNTRLSGSRGTIHILGDGERLELHAPAAPGSGYQRPVLTETPTPERSATQVAFLELRAALLDGRDAPMPLAAIERGQEMLFGFALSSLNGGARSSLVEVSPDLVITGRSGEHYA